MLKKQKLIWLVLKKQTLSKTCTTAPPTKYKCDTTWYLRKFQSNIISLKQNFIYELAVKLNRKNTYG